MTGRPLPLPPGCTVRADTDGPPRAEMRPTSVLSDCPLPVGARGAGFDLMGEVADSAWVGLPAARTVTGPTLGASRHEVGRTLARGGVELPFDLGGRPIVERRVEPLGDVEDLDVVLQSIDELSPRRPIARLDELDLEGAEEALRDGAFR